MKFDDLLTVAACCCCDLKTGALVLGYIELAFSVLSIMWGISDPVSFGFLLNGLHFLLFSLRFKMKQTTQKKNHKIKNIIFQLVSEQ